MTSVFFAMKLPVEVRDIVTDIAGTAGARGSNGRASTVVKQYLYQGLVDDGLLDKKILTEGDFSNERTTKEAAARPPA